MADETKDTNREFDYLDQKDFVLRLNQFDGGFVDSIGEDILKITECSQADEVTFTNHIINIRKGSQYYGTDATSGSFISLFYYEKY